MTADSPWKMSRAASATSSSSAIPMSSARRRSLDSDEVLSNWEKIKKEEKKEHRKYLVDDIPEAMPALFRAEKMQRRVAEVGFDWTDMKPVLDKVIEEFNEFKEAILKGDQANAEEEFGDIMFALVNVARHHKYLRRRRPARHHP